MTEDASELERRPAGADDATVEALGTLAAALDYVEMARGHLFSFHKLMASVDRKFGQGTEELRAAGHDDLADALNAEVLGLNPLPGMWSFQMVEGFDDGYYATIKGLEKRARDELVEGRRHVFEAEMKALRRTPGEEGHEAAPGEPTG